MVQEATRDVGTTALPSIAPTGSTRGGIALRLPYLPGLDGLRAIAVLAVMLYHAGIGWLPGGFLGVEIFFVISGYLITALLLSEWRRDLAIDFRSFWLRRARRLLPALCLLLLVFLAFAVIRLPDQVARLRGDAIASFFYVLNWSYIFRQQSYFEVIGRPSLFQHLWSLAIEEQFYLFWPPLLALGLRVLTRRRLLVALVVAAAASSLWMAVLYRPGVDPSRVYYGTDTRASGLLLGSALALGWAPWQPRERAAPALIGWLDRAGIGALLVLLLLFLRVDQAQAFLYRGGFALLGLATATLIAGTIAPGARILPLLLDNRPLRWVGERSYSLYLWHWPIFTVTRPQLDLPLDGPPLLILRLGLTSLCAALSYRYVERPIRRGALRRLWMHLVDIWRAPDRQGLRRIQAWGVGAGATLGVLLALGIAVVGAQTPPPDGDFGTGTIERGPSILATAEAETPPSPAPEVTGAGGAASPGICPPAIRTPLITAVGDSVLVAGAEKLEETIGDNIAISATVGRQAVQVPAILKERREAGALGSIVLIDIGSNSYVSADDFDAIMAETRGVWAVLFINVRVPREWEKANNTVLARGVARYPNAVLIDWYTVSGGHPEYLKDDGVHPYQRGREVYASLVARQVAQLQQRWAAESGCLLGPQIDPPGDTPAGRSPAVTPQFLAPRRRPTL
jgi:peptidoglycan/LPS O-acetylase OafA/YrhL